jgi:hypothetical protein
MDKIEISTNPKFALANGTIVQRGNVSLLTVFINYLVDIGPPMYSQFGVKHLSNGVYVELCGYLKMANQNLMFKKIHDYIRSIGKINSRCPAKAV